MKALKKVAIVLVALCGLFLLVGLMLPSSAHVERSVEVAAPADVIFSLVSDFRRQNEWSPWAKLDPNAKYTYSGPETGVGSKVSWTSENSQVGTGSQEIVEIDPPKMVKTALDFGEQGKANATFTLEPVGENVKVTWAFDSELDNVVARYFGLMMDGMVGGDFEKGLADIKRVSEAAPKVQPVALEITEQQVTEQPVLYVEGKCAATGEEIGKAMSAAYGKLNALLKEKNIAPTGAPIAVNIAHSETEYQFQAAMPVASIAGFAPSADVKARVLPATRALRAVHKGPYEGLPKTYDLIDEHFVAQNLKAGSPSWEQYVTDPAKTPPAELVTHVYYPIAAPDAAAP